MMTTPILDTRLAKLDELRWHVGQTPLYRMDSLSANPKVQIYAKLEWQQLGGSVKARPAYNILWNAAASGALRGRRLLDASSGNTGIAYAIFAAASGFPVTLCVPENASEERKHILRSLGVDLVLTSPFESTDGAQEVAKEMALKQPDVYHYVDQYGNDANWQAHYNHTGVEIWEETHRQVTHFVAGLGTTGTFTGTGKRLKECNENIELVALQPETALHGLEGWKHLETAKVPAIFDATVPDQTRPVSTQASYEMLKNVARQEGLLVSPSSAANLAGAAQLAQEIEEGVIVTVLADDAGKYSEVIQQLLP